MFAERVLSGMRPTGALHLGHYHGVLKNWVRLQAEYPCFFFVADWHALTTHYETPEVIQESVWEMVIDWLAAGVDPNQATLFIPSFGCFLFAFTIFKKVFSFSLLRFFNCLFAFFYFCGDFLL